MAKTHKLSKNGETIYPATTTDAVVHPTLKVSASKLIGEINVSNLYPTGGMDGTNKYTLESAIAKIPTDLRTVGLKCSFLDDSGELESWEYQGGTFTATGSWLVIGGKKLVEFEASKEPVPHGNIYIREMYLEGDFDKTHRYVLSRIARNTSTANIKWGVYVKDLDDNGIEYYFAFNDFSEEPTFIDKKVPRKTQTKEGTFYISAIINWECLNDGDYLYPIGLPLTDIFSLEKNPYIKSISDKILLDNKNNEQDLQIEVCKTKLLELEKHSDNVLTPLVLINKYMLNKSGFYDDYGAPSDNSSFQRTEYILAEGAKAIYCKNKNNFAGYKVLLMDGDSVLLQVPNDGTIKAIDLSDYPSCKSIKVCTAISDSDNFFVLVDYCNHLMYSKDEINKFVSDLNKKTDVITENYLFNKSAIWSESSGNLYIEFDNVEIEQSGKYIVRANANTDKLQEGAYWALAVTDIDGGYYYANGNIPFNQDVELTASKKIVKLQFQCNKAKFYKEEVEVTFLATIPNNGSLQYQIKEIDNRLSVLEGNNPHITGNTPSIHICKSINCVVGDTIQLYYNMFVQHIGDYSLNIKCSKGKNYPRYWEYTPTASDVGTSEMTIQLLNIDGSVIEEKVINIITTNAENPTSAKNILLVGDSLYMSGQIAIELSRRLKGTTGVATLPTALELSNINIVGRLKNADESVGWEGIGGWTWNTYLKRDGMAGARLTVSDITDVRPGDIYQISGYEQKFMIGEVNVTEGTGSVFGGFYGKGDIYNDHDLMPKSGTLNKVSGEGQSTIIFSNSSIETYNPFWNNKTDSFDISKYVNTYCGGHLEILCVQLGINSIIGANPFSTDFEKGVFADAKKFIDMVHSQLPKTKI